MSLHSYFDNIQEEIIDCLSKSNQSVKAAIAWLTDIQIINVLNKLTTQGVRIEIIINDDDINRSKSTELAQLERNGARIYFYPVDLGLMHHKFCVVDSNKLIMGSYNWTYSAANSNKESIVIVENEVDTITHFDNEFELIKSKLGIVESNMPSIHSDVLQSKTEIYFLESEIASLEIEKVELEKVILEFENLLKREVGALILEKLSLEKRLHELKAYLTQKKDDYDTLLEKEKIIEDYQKSWHKAIEKQDSSVNAAEEGEMKKLYRESMMMSHPDRFVHDFQKQEEANRLSSILSEAYKNKDFQKIKEVWTCLKNGLAFKSDWFSSNDGSFLKKLIVHLNVRKVNLENEIRGLKEHAVWTVRSNHSDYESYFRNLKNTIQVNISVLKNEIKNYQR